MCLNLKNIKMHESKLTAPPPPHTDAIVEHLLVPLVGAPRGASRTTPAPFRAAGVLPPLIQRSWGAAHLPSHG